MITQSLSQSASNNPREEEDQLRITIHFWRLEEKQLNKLAKGSSLAHLYGLPKTHKPQLSMRPILSAVGTYNYNLAKWLEEKLKPLSINNHTISNIFQFSDELVDLKLDENDILVSYGPLMANSFLCNIEETLEHNNRLPSFYKRYVDDTLAIANNIDAAESFLRVLNDTHPSLEFTMETAVDDSLPFLGMRVIKSGCVLQTEVYRKPTDKRASTSFSKPCRLQI
ncbi:uncharacterized protein [Montipora capricornis]|uniref:uncharacterized protein n=1 Tax=Montipora capricornis TaxID=246305 RepID=UPI0035F185A8